MMGTETVEGLTVRRSRIHGTGCYATRAFAKGETIGEYTGKIVSYEEAEEEGGRTYLFQIDDDRVIDATRTRNPMKYINHSCDPNCESEQDGDRIFVKAIVDIAPGEELTYDYNLDSEEEEPCHCGAPNCRGTMREAE